MIHSQDILCLQTFRVHKDQMCKKKKKKSWGTDVIMESQQMDE